MIKTKIIKDSRAENGKRITTFEIEFPRLIHAELMTHRALSKNAASSRAIPLKTMLGLVWNNPAEFEFWGKNQSGMQSKKELEGIRLKLAKFAWRTSGKIVCCLAWAMGRTGIHKQCVNRMLEPWSHIKVVVSGTEWDNFFHLRTHKDAQPEFQVLAKQMFKLYKESQPKLLKEGEWHLPYVEDEGLSLEDAKKLSASLCAQTSYRKANESIEKAREIYDRLVSAEVVHASPFEHVATQLPSASDKSGNFSGWKQLREEIPNNVCFKFKTKTK